MKKISDLIIENNNLKRELAFLYEVAKNVHSLEIGILLKEIVKISSRITGADSCLIYILDKEKEQLILKASKNPHPDLQLGKVIMRIGEGITGWVAKNRKAVIIEKNAFRDFRFKKFKSLPEDNYEAFLSVPIVNKIGTVGVINIQHKKPHQYSEMEVNLLTATGKLVGGALENAMLIEQTLELKEALEIRKIIERAKGILMKIKKCPENDAYSMIRNESMNSRKTLKEVAEAIILAEKMKISFLTQAK